MIIDFGIDGVYVVHALKNYERHEKHVNALFEKHGLKHQFMTKGDPSLVTPEVLSYYFVPKIKDILSLGVLSCTLNHILCYEAVVKNNNKLALIFENDPFFLKHFDERLRKVVEEAKQLPPGFIVSLENSSLTFPPFRKLKRNQFLYPAGKGRMAGAYLIDFLAAQNMLAEIKKNKCDTVIDWWHNHLIEKNIVKMYWAHPPLTEQGSHNGELSSTISSKGASWVRKLRWKTQKIYKTFLYPLLSNKE
jgi:glycosyl transferase family 25